MISSSWRKGVTATLTYFDEHLAHGEYYLRGEEIESYAQWLGSGAERLGLEGTVERDQFEALANNLHPETGEQLTERMNKSENRRTFWDLAISPPKDVSVLEAFAQEEESKKIRGLHLEASLLAAKELEKFLGVRVRDQGQNHSKFGTSEAVIAAVLHDTARPVDGIPDPHLHTHLLFANAVYDRESKRWLALQNQRALEAQQYVRQSYYNTLAHGLQKLGYTIETREAQKDFQIAGLPREFVDTFSRRTDQVTERIREKFTRGMKDYATAKEMAVTESRESKVDLKTPELKAGWAAIAGAEKLKAFHNFLSEKKSQTISAEEGLEHLEVNEAIHHAKNHVFTNQSVVAEHEVLADILRRGRGKITNAEAKKALKEDPDFLSAPNDASGRFFTTRQVVAEEKNLLHLVNAGIDQHNTHAQQDHVVPPSPAGETWQYSDEQREVIEGLLKNRDFVTALNGVAGAGKTSLLKEVEHGIKANGGRIVALAPSGDATDILRKEGFQDAENLQQWQANPKLREATKGATLVIDEASLISAPDLLDTLKKAKLNDSRVILVGDVKQIGSVGRGDAFRLLQERSKIKTVTIEQTRRQKDLNYREALQHIRHAASRNDWQKAWQAIEDLGSLYEVDGDNEAERLQKLTEQVAKEFGKEEDHLIIAGNWERIRALNDQIRKDRKDRNELHGEGLTRRSLEPVHLSAAEVRQAANYQAGQTIELLQNIKDLGYKGEQFEITGRTYHGLRIKDSQGLERIFHQRKHASKFVLYNERKIEVAQGDKLLIKKEHENLKNGQILTLTKLNEDKSLLVSNKEGELSTIPADFAHILHGYAVTAHASQGATVKKATVIGNGLRKEQFYVAASRAKEEVKIFTTDLERLKGSVAQSAARPSGIDIVKTPTSPSPQIIAKRQESALKSKYKKHLKKASQRFKKFVTSFKKKDQEISAWWRQTTIKQAHERRQTNKHSRTR